MKGANKSKEFLTELHSLMKKYNVSFDLYFDEFYGKFETTINIDQDSVEIKVTVSRKNVKKQSY